MKEGKIKDFCTVIAGQSPQGSSYNEEGIGMEFHQGKKAFGETLLEHSNVWTTEITKVAKEGDILMSVRAPVGPTNMTDREICIGRGLAAIRCTDAVIPRYVLYALRNIENKIVGNDGAVFNSINKRMIEDLPLPNFDLQDQRRIVSRLDSAFSQIDELKANAEKQLSEAKALFQKALAEEMKPKEGWEGKTLGEITVSMADGPFGSNLKKEHYTTNKEVRIIQLSNIGEEGWREDNTKYTTFEHLKTIQRSEVKPGDVVIAKMMPAGRAILCPDNESKYVLSSDAVRATLKEGLDKRFVCFAINSSSFRRQVYANVSGSGRVRTSLTKLRDCKLYIPSPSDQQAIVTRLDTLSSQVRNLEKNCRKTLAECDALKQAMLREVFE